MTDEELTSLRAKALESIQVIMRSDGPGYDLKEPAAHRLQAMCNLHATICVELSRRKAEDGYGATRSRISLTILELEGHMLDHAKPQPRIYNAIKILKEILSKGAYV